MERWLSKKKCVTGTQIRIQYSKLAEPTLCCYKLLYYTFIKVNIKLFKIKKKCMQINYAIHSNIRTRDSSIFHKTNGVKIMNTEIS